MNSNELKYKRILWLCPPNFSGGQESLLKSELKLAGLDECNIYIKCLTIGALKKRTKTTYTWDQSKYPKFIKDIHKFNADFIVCNDKAALGLLTQNYISTNLTRGSIYKIPGLNPVNLDLEIPVLVVDGVKRIKYVDDARWIFRQDLAKLKRWITGKHRHQPKFQYRVAESKEDLKKILELAYSSIAIAVDIETSGTGKYVFFTCVGYTFWQKNGEVMTWVIPFVDSTTDDGCYWLKKETEEYAHETIRLINASPAYKIMQNGSYDATHFITYHAAMHNYTIDTLHMFHSIWLESRKKLDFISSICLDFYRYWKDESKEDEKDDTITTMVPQTSLGMKEYWRYNALDCYYTMCNALYLIQIYSVPSMSWAKLNYIKEFRQTTGPALAGSLRGIRWNTKLQQDFAIKLTEESEQALVNLKLMVGDPTFNPNSQKQMPQLIYDILRAEPLPRKKRTVQEDVLKLIATQHPLYNRIIKEIWNVKKPANNASKYGQCRLLNNRFMYKLSPATAETTRYGSKASDFWVGNNIQNVPEPMRVLFEPDNGYVLFDFDYSQSDAYFTAFESQDPKYMATMVDERDVHCVHAAHFFQKPYEELYQAKVNHEEWCTHKVKGVRSVTKRVVYGANYLMAAYTLLITMGRDAVVAAAEHLGYKDAGGWTLKQLVYLCGKFLEAYFEMYPVLKPWLDEEISKGIANGNKVKCFGGATRIFFGNLNEDKIQRKLASFFGQGGTAGNINAFIDDFFYHDDKFLASNPIENRIHDSDDIMFLFQVHDSVIGQVKIEKLHLLKTLKRQMERECEIHGRKFIVPVEGQVGFGWGKRMMDWRPDITIKEIQQHEDKWWSDYIDKNRKGTNNGQIHNS